MFTYSRECSCVHCVCCGRIQTTTLGVSLYFFILFIHLVQGLKLCSSCSQESSELPLFLLQEHMPLGLCYHIWLYLFRQSQLQFSQLYSEYFLHLSHLPRQLQFSAFLHVIPTVNQCTNNDSITGFITAIYLYVCVNVYWLTYTGFLFLFYVWVLRIKLMSPGLETGTSPLLIEPSYLVPKVVF